MDPLMITCRGSSRIIVAKQKDKEKCQALLEGLMDPLMITSRGSTSPKTVPSRIIVAGLFDLGLDVGSGRIMGRKSRRPLPIEE